MTNQQLYLAVGLPVIVNGLLFTLLWLHLDRRFDDLKELWRAELRRVEEVIDARLKHLEER
jgi:uncharacterized protein YjeT (DUF2065 family)